MSYLNESLDLIKKEFEDHCIETDKKLDELKERISLLSSETRRQRLFGELKKARHDIIKSRKIALTWFEDEFK